MTSFAFFVGQKESLCLCVSQLCVCVDMYACGGVINLLSLLIVDNCPEGKIIIDGLETF